MDFVITELVELMSMQTFSGDAVQTAVEASDCCSRDHQGEPKVPSVDNRTARRFSLVFSGKLWKIYSEKGTSDRFIRYKYVFHYSQPSGASFYALLGLVWNANESSVTETPDVGFTGLSGGAL